MFHHVADEDAKNFSPEETKLVTDIGGVGPPTTQHMVKMIYRYLYISW